MYVPIGAETTPMTALEGFLNWSDTAMTFPHALPTKEIAASGLAVEMLEPLGVVRGGQNSIVY